ncbi:MAG: B12-binding domain-containing radical SAM protein [Spirochaetes bacterium RBG_13_51_14]|nr:MAG: B12-binding domain-containing radical SAM protein [Spirochaetes bacterium RBG_13_51_14]
MKVLLISANTVRTPYYVYPLGLDYVTAALSSRHIVRIADINIMKGMDPLISIINDFVPDVIGLSLRNIDNVDSHDTKSFIPIYRNLVEAIRRHSTAAIVLGGSGFTIFPKKLMDILKADYGIIGEGERLSLLLDAIETGGNAAAIPGVITGASSEAVPAPLDTEFHRKFDGGAHAHYYIARGGMLNLQTKRGCCYTCIYCTYPFIEGAEFRLIPADEVADTALALERAGAKYFFITDSVFNGSYQHSAEVARAFKKKGLSIPWGAFFAPTKPPDDYYRVMHDAGMTHAEFGTESLSGPMLAAYRKPFSINDVFAAHAAALDAGLYAAHYILLGGPGENRDTLDETLRNAERLEKTVIFFFCGIRIYPNTRIYDIALKEGQISKSDDLLEPVFYQSRSISSEEIYRIVADLAKGKENWFIGTGGSRAARLISRLHKQGHTGPLWEHMIR